MKRTQRETIYTGVSLEFVQPWDRLKMIRATKELGLGNLIGIPPTYHVGNSEEDRQQWKRLYPQFADLVDKVPKAKTLHEKGSPVVFPITEADLLEQLRLCRELGLYVELPFEYFGVTPEERQRLIRRINRDYRSLLSPVGFPGETTSVFGEGMPARAWKARYGLDIAKMNMASMRQWCIDRQRKVVAQAKAERFFPLSSNCEATVQFRLALEAGVKIPLLEGVPTVPLVGLAATRGAARAYRSPFWGVCFAFGWYSAPADERLPNRARIGYNLLYAGGASLFNDLNYFFHVYSAPSGFFTEQARPPLRRGEKEYRGFDDPICVDARRHLSDHYRFVRFHDRPPGGPRVKIACVLGHLDSWTGHTTGQTHVWGVSEPGWEAGDAEKTWHLFHRLYEPDAWYTPPRRYYWQADPVQVNPYGAPPCGQVDIVPMEAPLSVLQSYSALIFLGWNTMTDKIYAKLSRYVARGGRLLMSVPQLSTQVLRSAKPRLIHDGKVEDLFGARISGAGRTPEMVQFVRPSTCAQYRFPDRTMYIEGTQLAKVRLAGATVLAESKEGDPLLLEHRKGKGFAYLLTTWAYPGLRLESFMTDVLRTISIGEQDAITVQGESVFYAVYPRTVRSRRELSVVYIVNKSIYGLTNYCRLGVEGRQVPIRVDGFAMRVAWVAGDLVVSPFDRFVKVESVKARRDGYAVRLVAEKGRHRVQLAWLGGEIGRVLLDGKRVPLRRDADGSTALEAAMDGAHDLVVRMK